MIRGTWPDVTVFEVTHTHTHPLDPTKANLIALARARSLCTHTHCHWIEWIWISFSKIVGRDRPRTSRSLRSLESRLFLLFLLSKIINDFRFRTEAGRIRQSDLKSSAIFWYLFSEADFLNLKNNQCLFTSITRVLSFWSVSPNQHYMHSSQNIFLTLKTGTDAPKTQYSLQMR